MDFFVLVKYVADVERIPEDAWDTERGLLRRGMLRMVANPLDDRALQLALDIRNRTTAPHRHDAGREATGRGRVVVLSMGPPQAEEICRRALAHGADHAVLLSDRAFAGADTIATARTIAAALQRLVADCTVHTPLVVAGMQSPDGDTAQVPIQVAALMEYPLIPYVTAWSEATAGLSFETLQPVGRSRLTLCRAPALATVTAFLPGLPRYVSLQRMSRASEAHVPIWGREDVGVAEAQAGLAGSRTRVVEIFSPPRTGRRGYRVEFGGAREPLEELPLVLEQLERYLRTGGVAEAGDESADTPPAPDGADQTRGAPAGGKAPDVAAGGEAPDGESGAVSYYRGECVVMCERDGDSGEVSRGSRELLGVAAGLAEQLATRTTALVLGEVRQAEQALLARLGADRVVSVRSEFSQTFVAEEHARAAAYALRKIRSQVVLVPATLTGRVVAPLLAAYLGAGLTADCTGLKIADYRGRAGGRHTVYRQVLFQTRPALGGNVMATIVSLRGRENGAPQMVSARPGVFTPIEREGVSAAVEVLTPTCGELEMIGSEATNSELINSEAVGSETMSSKTIAVRVAPRGDGVAAASGGRVEPENGPAAAPRTAGSVPRRDEPPLEECDVIVSVGLGIGGKENVDRLARPLIRALEQAWGVTVGLGCSRAAMEAGYLPHSVQVGQTGKTVKPQVYIALGISGAVQHRVGMENAGRILSINSDDEAPLFSSSDYVIRARCEDAVPVLLQLLQGGR